MEAVFKKVHIEDIEEFKPDSIVSGIQAQRETCILQLEGLIATATNNLLEGKERLESAVRENTKAELDKIYAHKGEMLAELERREAAINERANKLDKEQEQFDKRQSKYLRREIRTEILADATSFLSDNKPKKTAVLLRLPNDFLFIICISLFFSLFFFGLKDVHDALMANGKTNLTFYLIRQSLYFTSAFVFVLLYSRWISSWYKRHADAEDFYKLFKLDFNRANWIVEMAIEWREGTNETVPQELLGALSKNIFAYKNQQEEQPTPIKEALATLNSLEISTPSGSKLSMDVGKAGSKKV